ncbi:MAG: PQQ-binding-like beta-propeller repeat protein [Planctomycetaceae bacterium]
MNRVPRRLMLLQLLCVCGSSVASADNWPQFRGPTGQGVAADTPVPTRWSEQQGIRWKTAVPGKGHSSPVIWGEQIWMSTASADGRQLGAICMDRGSGKVLREIPIFSPGHVEEIHDDNSYASPTPVLAEGRAYFDFGTYGAACVDTESGELLWRNTELAIDHQGGPGSSPVLFGETLLIHRDGADAQYVAALDVNNGRIRWKRARSAPYRDNPITHRAFATPLLYEHGGRTLLISPAADQCHAYDAATGEELWHVRYVGFSNVPCPVAVGDRVYICTGFFQPLLLCVRLGGRGDVTETHVEWEYKAQIPEVSSPIAVDGRIYFASSKGVLTCLDAATGERKKTLRLGGNYSASPLAAGGLLYFCSREGFTKVVRPGDDSEVLETNKLNGHIHASPVALDGVLYVRTETHLYCIANDDAAPSAASSRPASN